MFVSHDAHLKAWPLSWCVMAPHVLPMNFIIWCDHSITLLHRIHLAILSIQMYSAVRESNLSFHESIKDHSFSSRKSSYIIMCWNEKRRDCLCELKLWYLILLWTSIQPECNWDLLNQKPQKFTIFIIRLELSAVPYAVHVGCDHWTWFGLVLPT